MRLESAPVFAYRPAEMSIRTRSAELEMDWREVWDSIGLENPLSYMRSRNESTRQESTEAIAQQVRDGDRVARSVHKKEENVFGNLAMEKYLRERKLETKLVLMPSDGPDIKVTTYKPEIRIDPQLPALSTNGIRSTVSLQPIASQSATFVDTKV